MAQKKINPIAFRLSIKQTWWSIFHNNWPSKIVHEDTYIRKLIDGVFKKFNVLTSPVVIKRKENFIFLDFLVYMNNKKGEQNSKMKQNLNFPHNIFKVDKELIAKKGYKRSTDNFITNKIPTKNLRISKDGIWNLIKSPKTYYLNNSEFKLTYLKSIVVQILEYSLKGKKVYINITEAPSLISDAKILSDWISNEINANPNQYKFILNKVIHMFDKNKEAVILNNANKQNISIIKEIKENLKINYHDSTTNTSKYNRQ